MSRVRGRAFKITRNQAKGYGYARPAYRRNPGVTTIAAINGRGSYAGSRSARSVMSKLKRNARVPAARKALTASQKRAFQAKLRRNRSTSSTQRATSRKNIRKAQAARKAWGRKLPRGRRVRVGRATYGRKPKARRLKAGVYVANRRKKAGSKTMARRRRKSAKGATKKRRRSSKRRRRTTTKSAAPKRRRRRKSRKAGAGKRRIRRRGSARRRRSSRKGRRFGERRGNPRRRRSRKAASPRRRRRRSKSVAPRRRRSRRKGSARRRRRSKSAAPRRRRRSRKGSARRRAAPRRRRRGSRKVAQHMQAAGKRGQYKLNRRRRHRRNGRRLFKRNGAGDFLKMGAMLFAGFGLHRLLTNLVDRQLLSRLLPAPVATPAATSGFGLQENRGLIASVVVGAGAAFLANKVVKNAETKKLIIGGIAVSTVQGVIMSLLKAFVPQGADMLAGPDDGTAARLSAMYGLGAGASIMPRYGVINGMGEYFREPMNGLGEYFREPMNGVGEYIAATAGLGTYEQNNDLYQAAAGMGNHDYNGNHIDPSGDLDRQLTIAEAAAGVGALSPFEAAAGIGPMQAAAGFGAIDTVPSGDTWVPGSVNPQLWAGVRAVDQSQAATEMVPAGVLQTDGGQGIFG